MQIDVCAPDGRIFLEVLLINRWYDRTKCGCQLGLSLVVALEDSPLESAKCSIAPDIGVIEHCTEGQLSRSFFRDYINIATIKPGIHGHGFRTVLREYLPRPFGSA